MRMVSFAYTFECQKHGLSIGMIESLIAQPLAILPGAVDSRKEAAFALWDKPTMGEQYFLCSRCGARAKSN